MINKTNMYIFSETGKHISNGHDGLGNGRTNAHLYPFVHLKTCIYVLVNYIF